MYRSLKKIKSQIPEGGKKVISVAIRIKNEMIGLPDFLNSLRGQTIFNKAELTILDSGSTDGSLSYINENLPCNLYSIDSSEFSFGASCNLMMELTHCDYVFFFSGHVYLQENDLLEKAYLQVSKEPSSGYFRQQPNKLFGSSIYDEAFLNYRFSKAKSGFPILIKGKNSFSNAASMVNRQHWQLHKFKDVIFGEDSIWADEILRSGGKVLYFPYLSVLHSHNDDYATVYTRILKAAKVKYPQGVGNLLLASTFLKVFGAIFLHSGKFLSAARFAYAHSKAYADINQKTT